MADIDLVLKLEAFNAFTRELAKRTNTDLRVVIKSEAAKVLEAAGKRTKTATAESIRASQRTPPRSPWRIYGGQSVKVTWRFPNDTWAFIKSQLDKSIQQKILMSGLARSAWKDLAEMMDERIKVSKAIKPVNKPAGFRGRSQVIINEDPDRYAITISHNSNALYYANGRQALFAAIAGRIRYYEMNTKHGVFKSAQATAKKYPGIRVSRT
jgi:hypothetical protein